MEVEEEEGWVVQKRVTRRVARLLPCSLCLTGDVAMSRCEGSLDMERMSVGFFYFEHICVRGARVLSGKKRREKHTQVAKTKAFGIGYYGVLV